MIRWSNNILFSCSSRRPRRRISNNPTPRTALGAYSYFTASASWSEYRLKVWAYTEHHQRNQHTTEPTAARQNNTSPPTRGKSALHNPILHLDFPGSPQSQYQAGL